MVLGRAGVLPLISPSSCWPRLRSEHVNVATEENVVNNSNEELTSPAPTPQSEHKFMLL